MKTKKQKLHFTRLTAHLQFLLATLTLCTFAGGAFAQNTASYKKFINTTAVAVFEAQKTMIAANRTSPDGKLANLIQQQMNAVVLFNRKEYARAAYYSNLARQQALELIESLNGKKNELYTVSAEEKKLFEQLPVVNKPDTSTELPLTTRGQDYLIPGSIKREQVEVW